MLGAEGIGCMELFNLLMSRGLGKLVDDLFPDLPDSPCSRCGAESDCRDVLGTGKLICVGCSTPRERDAFFRRLIGAEPLS